MKKKILITLSIFVILLVVVGAILGVYFNNKNKENKTANAAGISTRVEILQTQLKSVETDLLEISDKQNPSDEFLSNKFEELTTKLAGVAENLSIISGELLGISELSKVNYNEFLTRVENVEKSLIEIKSDLSSLKTLETKVDNLEKSIKALIVRVTELENNSAEEAELQVVRQEIATLQAELNILKTNQDNAICSEIIYENTKNSLNFDHSEGIQGGITVNGFDFSKYEYLRVFVRTNGAVMTMFIDLNYASGTSVTELGEVYFSSSASLAVTGDGFYFCSCYVNESKNSFTCYKIGVYDNGEFKDRTINGLYSGSYFVYRIEGIY